MFQPRTAFRNLLSRHPVSALGRPVFVVAAVLALGACATVPQPLTGNYATLEPTQAAQGGAGGTQVRWGGQIIKTQPEANQTCFFMLAHPLDDTARPLAGSASQGRFVACHKGFYDPEVFTKGRELTVTGTLHGIVSDMVGKYNYAYPRVEAQTIYLWPKRPHIVRYNNPAFNNPFWGPIGPRYNPYWYSPRVIYINRGHHRHRSHRSHRSHSRHEHK